LIISQTIWNQKF